MEREKLMGWTGRQQDEAEQVHVHRELSVLHKHAAGGRGRGAGRQERVVGVGREDGMGGRTEG